MDNLEPYVLLLYFSFSLLGSSAPCTDWFAFSSWIITIYPGKKETFNKSYNTMYSRIQIADNLCRILASVSDIVPRFSSVHNIFEVLVTRQALAPWRKQHAKHRNYLFLKLWKDKIAKSLGLKAVFNPFSISYVLLNYSWSLLCMLIV